MKSDRRRVMYRYQNENVSHHFLGPCGWRSGRSHHLHVVKSRRDEKERAHHYDALLRDNPLPVREGAAVGHKSQVIMNVPNFTKQAALFIAGEKDAPALLNPHQVEVQLRFVAKAMQMAWLAAKKQTQTYVQSNDSQAFGKRINELLVRGGRMEPNSLQHSVTVVDGNRTVFLGMAVVNMEEPNEPELQAGDADQRPG